MEGYLSSGRFASVFSTMARSQGGTFFSKTSRPEGFPSMTAASVRGTVSRAKGTIPVVIS